MHRGEGPLTTEDRGRDAHYWTPPARIRTSPIRASGSYLGCLTAKHVPYAAQRLGHALPALGPVRALLVRVSLGPCPWLHRLRNRQPSLFGGFTAVGSEEARSIALALASVRRSNWACSFPAPSFHEDEARRAAMEGIIAIRFTSPYSP